MSAPLFSCCYSLSRHAVERFAAAKAIDPITGILRAHADLAVSRLVTHDEARLFLGAGLRQREGRSYRAGVTGIYVCVGNHVLTYIDREKPAEIRRLRFCLRRSRRHSR